MRPRDDRPNARRPSGRTCLAAAVLFSLLSAAPGPSLAEQLVRFGAVPAGKAATRRADARIQGYLTKPNGRGPFAAVVLLHSCLGLPANRRSIADAVSGWGYAALFVDEFTTRGISETCTRDFPEGSSDAFGALRYLSRLRFVDRTRIAVIGYSQGGDTALMLASERGSPGEASGGARFGAAAAFYPPCANRENALLSMPTLILIGASDSVTPAGDCLRLAEAQRGNSMLKLVVYPGAFHCFDDPEFAGGKHVLGMQLQYDGAAAEQSLSELHDFLARTLGR